MGKDGGENRDFFLQVDPTRSWYHFVDLDELIILIYGFISF